MNAATLAPAVARLTRAAVLVASTVSQRPVAELEGDDLLKTLRDAADARNAAELLIAALTAEVAERSRRERGYDGLAQQHGHRTATSLVQNVTGQSRADVGRALRTGSDLAADLSGGHGEVGDGGAAAPVDGATAAGPPGATAGTPADAVPVATRWQHLLRAALVDGHITQAQYQAIRMGLGEPPVERYPDLDPGFLPAAWGEAVDLLLAEASDVPVEELRLAARTARDRLDPIGVTLRFEERFAARSFRMWVDEHGQQHARLAFDDDAAAWVQAILHAALRPRRGPRFVGPDARDRADEAAADERSNEQLQYDTLMAVLRTGAAADPSQAFGDRQPGVRILVEQTALAETAPAETAIVDAVRVAAAARTRVTGVGHVEDGGVTLPAGVVERYLCDAGSLRVALDHRGRPLDVGREQRLFTRTQRIAIAARDGGCVGPFCTAPISWCEYHHIDHWAEDGGRTDVDDGVPLCRNCHLRLHNQGHRIRRERDPVFGRDTYSWHAPPDPVTGAVPDPIVLRGRSPRRFAAA